MMIGNLPPPVVRDVEVGWGAAEGDFLLSYIEKRENSDKLVGFF